MTNKQKSVVIVNGSRTPMGSLKGSLKSLTAVELGAHAIKHTLLNAKVNTDIVDEVIMGNVLSAGLRQGPARQAALTAGLPNSTGCVTINKLCGSGMQATIFAHDAIISGTAKTVISGGMESMTNAPHLVLNSRNGVQTGNQTLADHMFFDGLQDASTSRAMGSFAQETADERGMTREDMDDFAITSLNRAKKAMQENALKDEIAPITIKTRKKEIVVSEDEQPLSANIEKIPKLRPAFSKDGSMTAANSSSISDGASALLLMDEDFANQQGISSMARIIGHARHSQHPSEFTVAPVGAIKELLSKINWTIEDVDLWEINEAFAMVTMIANTDLKLDTEKVNIYGGACAQGHPIGSTGSRIILTLMHALKHKNLKRGVAALCIGGGEATAIAIELV
jgi:acetyl-CoA C-acetyltransferase